MRPAWHDIALMLFWFRPWDSFFQEMTLNLSDILNDWNNRWMAERARRGGGGRQKPFRILLNVRKGFHGDKGRTSSGAMEAANVFEYICWGD